MLIADVVRAYPNILLGMPQYNVKACRYLESLGKFIVIKIGKHLTVFILLSENKYHKVSDT